MKTPKIYIIDVTNRDGIQSHGIYLSDLEKTMINFFLSKMGIFQSEFGFPFSLNDKKYIESNLALMHLMKPMKLEGWIRAIEEDVISASKYKGLKHLNMSMSTSDVMIKAKFNGKYNKKDILFLMEKSVLLAKKKGFETIGVNAEDASRTDLKYLIDFGLRAKNAGADRLRYCDTLGYDTPYSIYKTIFELAKKIQMPIELHCHNDLGNAVSNSIEGARACLDAGVDAYINTTLNSVGERTGNADLVSVLLSLKYGKDSLGITKEDLSKAYEIANYVSIATGRPIPSNAPGVGSDVFSHQSGLHADGMIKSRSTYELYCPEDLGIPSETIQSNGRKISIGDYSGKKAFDYVLDKNGIEKCDENYDLLKKATKSVKRELIKEEIEFIINNVEFVKNLI